jgi:hypothetical protein
MIDADEQQPAQTEEAEQRLPRRQHCEAEERRLQSPFDRARLASGKGRSP